MLILVAGQVKGQGYIRCDAPTISTIGIHQFSYFHQFFIFSMGFIDSSTKSYFFPSFFFIRFDLLSLDFFVGPQDMVDFMDFFMESPER